MKKTIPMILGIIVVIVMFVVFLSATTIKTGQVGLIVRFGEIQETTLSSGINFVVPVLDKVVKLDTKIQERLIDVGDEIHEPIKGITKDRVSFYGNNLSVAFYVEPTEAADVYLIANSENLATTVVRVQDISEAFQKAVSEKNSSEIYGGSSISDEMKEMLQQEVDERFGEGKVYITKMTVGEATFSAEYNDALVQKASAQIQQDQARIENQTELEKINAQAERARIQAETEKTVAEIEAQIKVVEAKAEAEANKAIAESITPEMIDYMEAEARKEHGWVAVQGGTAVASIPIETENEYE